MTGLILTHQLSTTSGKYFQLYKQIKSSIDSYQLSYTKDLWEKSLNLIEERLDEAWLVVKSSLGWGGQLKTFRIN